MCVCVWGGGGGGCVRACVRAYIGYNEGGSVVGREDWREEVGVRGREGRRYFLIKRY